MNTDTAESYFNFTHPHSGCMPGFFRHRLGSFQTAGGGQRKTQAAPRLGILHVPVFERLVGSNDYTAEWVAAYLANPEKGKYGNVHATADRDSYVLCLPIDSICWGCGNFNTAADSWEVEIAGMATEPGSYWSGPDGTRKLLQAAKAHIAAAKLAFGDEWRTGIVPPQRGQVDAEGQLVSAGWLQHRDIPYWDERRQRWAQPPRENIQAGQHSDICADFPMEHWFQILAQEINAG